VMLAVMGHPPAGAHLTRRCGHQGPQPNDWAWSLIAAMGNQAMQDCGDGQHAKAIESQSPKRSPQAQTCHDQQAAAQVGHRDEHGTQTVKKTTNQESPVAQSAASLRQRRDWAESSGEASITKGPGRSRWPRWRQQRCRGITGSTGG
jgi:hypothetical protein